MTDQLNVPAELDEILLHHAIALMTTKGVPTKQKDLEARAALLSLIEQVVNKAIDTTTDLYFTNRLPRSTKELMDYTVAVREGLREAQRQTLATILGKEK